MSDVVQAAGPPKECTTGGKIITNSMLRSFSGAIYYNYTKSTFSYAEGFGWLDLFREIPRFPQLRTAEPCNLDLPFGRID